MQLRERVDALRRQIAAIRYQEARAKGDRVIAQVAGDAKAVKTAVARIDELEKEALTLVEELELIIRSLRAGWDIAAVAEARINLSLEAGELRSRIDTILPVIAGLAASGLLGELPAEAVHELQQLTLRIDPVKAESDDTVRDLRDAVGAVGVDAEQLQEILELDARLWTLEGGRFGLKDMPRLLKHIHGGQEIGIIVAIYKSIRLANIHKQPEARLPGLPPTAARLRELEALRREDERKARQARCSEATAIVRARPTLRGTCPPDLLDWRE